MNVQRYIATGTLAVLIVVVLAGCRLPGPAVQILARTRQLIHQLNDTAQPSADIIALADQATMTDQARSIFYSADPVVDSDRATFDQDCQAPASKRVVELGCYTSDNRIFLLDIQTATLSEEMPVAAAHEMLHAAYAQMSADEQATLDSQLEAQMAALRNPQLNREMSAYRALEPGQQDNELHSILGTEYAPLSPQLEQYYAKYFTNRATIVADAKRFNQAFSQVNSNVASLRSQQARLRTQAAAALRRRDTATYNALVRQINSITQQIDQDIAAYNALSDSLLGNSP